MSAASDANTAAAPELQYVGNWPHLDATNLAVIIAINIGAFIAAVILLRYVWKIPTEKEIAYAHRPRRTGRVGTQRAGCRVMAGARCMRDCLVLEAHLNSRVLSFVCLPSYVSNRKEYEIRHNLLLQSYEQYGSTSDGAAPIECIEGESQGDYTTEWTHTFDLVFLILMGVLLAGLCVWTELSHPELFTNGWFWIEQLPKIALMMAVSLVGGLLCRKFCDIDADGYIITNKNTVFKGQTRYNTGRRAECSAT